MSTGGAGDAAGANLQPGEDIRPHVGPEEARALASSLYGLSRVSVRQLNAYDDKNFHLQVEAEEAKNSGIWEYGFVLKVLNSLDSRRPELVEAQNKLMLFLGTKGIVSTQPIKDVHGNYYSLETISGTGNEGKKYIVRLLTFQPGEILYNIPCTPSLLYQTGSYLANLNNLLKDFHHPGFENRSGVWMLESVPQVKKFTFAVEDALKKNLVTEVINAFENEVVPLLPTLERGLIHGDFNEHNILVNTSADGSSYIHGVIDWGDCHISCYVFELAITICYMMIQSKLLPPLEAPGHVIAGYITKRKLPEREFQLLQICISARLCQSLVLGAYSHMHDPTNQYLLTTAVRGWEVLRQLWTISKEDLHTTWKQIMKSYTP